MMSAYRRRASAIFLTLWILTTQAFAQWSNEWASAAISDNFASGWVAFHQAGNDWEYRFYLVDSTSFRLMSSPYSLNPQYVYTFSFEERQAGGLIYSLETDLTGDGNVEFYVMAYYGAASPYRQTFKIVNLVTGATLFERNSANSSYSYPTIWDADNDQEYECTFWRWDYPYQGVSYYESWNTGVPTESNARPSVPLQMTLQQNYPNPFNPVTRFDYAIAQGGHVRLDITNELGQHVRTLVNGPLSPGIHSASWEGLSESGRPAASGVYFYRLTLDGKPVETRRMTLVR